MSHANIVAKCWSIVTWENIEEFWSHYAHLMDKAEPKFYLKNPLCSLICLHKDSFIFEQTVKELKVPVVTLYQRSLDMVMVRSGVYLHVPPCTSCTLIFPLKYAHTHHTLSAVGHYVANVAPNLAVAANTATQNALEDQYWELEFHKKHAYSCYHCRTPSKVPLPKFFLPGIVDAKKIQEDKQYVPRANLYISYNHLSVTHGDYDYREKTPGYSYLVPSYNKKKVSKTEVESLMQTIKKHKRYYQDKGLVAAFRSRLDRAKQSHRLLKHVCCL